VLDPDRIKAHAFGANALFEAWVAQEKPNAPLVVSTRNVRARALQLLVTVKQGW
jgi:hypothetical protein